MKLQLKIVHLFQRVAKGLSQRHPTPKANTKPKSPPSHLILWAESYHGFKKKKKKKKLPFSTVSHVWVETLGNLENINNQIESDKMIFSNNWFLC